MTSLASHRIRSIHCLAPWPQLKMMIFRSHHASFLKIENVVWLFRRSKWNGAHEQEKRREETKAIINSFIYPHYIFMFLTLPLRTFTEIRNHICRVDLKEQRIIRKLIMVFWSSDCHIWPGLAFKERMGAGYKWICSCLLSADWVK